MSETEKYLENYLLIKKTTESIRLSNFPGYKEFEDDVLNEAFIKLFKSGFFDREEQKRSYIYRAVNHCFIDHLKAIGIIRNLSKSEKEQSGHKTQNVVNIGWDDMTDNSMPESEMINPDSHVEAEDAYRWIKDCYDAVYKSIKDQSRKAFFESSFWWYNDRDVSTKDLASLVGYDSSNPTQELKRLIQKVSMCTQPHGITVVNPHEQVQFLQEQIQYGGGVS